VRFAGQLLGIVAQHLLDRSNLGRQTKALEGAVHILPSHLKAGHEHKRGVVIMLVMARVLHCGANQLCGVIILAGLGCVQLQF
jgi:hypothetical protein